MRSADVSRACAGRLSFLKRSEIGARSAVRALALAAAVLGGGVGRADAEGGAHRLAPDFSLIDQTGKPFTLSHFRGRPVVLFFGYAHCPDECPTVLANLKVARKALGPQGASILVALVTVDPERDKVADLRRYVSGFDPSFVGLTGSGTELNRVYRAYHVRITKSDVTSTGYDISHTSFVYYIGRDGRFRSLGVWSDSIDVLEGDLRTIAGST